MKLEFTIAGDAALRTMLQGMESGVVPQVARSLVNSLEQVLTVSKDVYVPIDTGFLKSSGYVSLTSGGSAEVVVEIGYRADYAIYVHEINKAYKGGRQWKYLETPLKAALPHIKDKLSDDLIRWIEATK